MRAQIDGNSFAAAMKAQVLTDLTAVLFFLFGSGGDEVDCAGSMP